MAEVRETISIGSKADTRGFKKAESAAVKLTRTLRNLAGAFGVTYSTAQVIKFGKVSVRAFAEMEAQQDRLIRLMKVGVGASNAQIQSLNSQAAALENLGVVSKGNITQVQSQLATFNLQAATISKLTPAILDYVTAEKGATASTEQFKMMTNGLAQALNGNFTSLTRVGFVIDQTTRDIIKNGSEAERTAAIVQVLDSTYKGFNKSLRDTPIGQMQLLANAADDAKETIGEGLLDALTLLGGQGANDIENATRAMNDLSTATADVIRGQAVVLSNLGGIGGGTVGKIGNAVKTYFKEVLGIQALQDLGAATRPRPRAGRFFGGSSIQGNIYDPVAAKRAKDAAALAKKQLDATKKLTAEQKKQNALKKSATVFDLDQIQLIAALKGKLSEEDRKRIEAQLALLNNNDALATKLTREILMAQDATGGLYRYFLSIGDADIKNPFAFLDDWIIQFQNKLNNLKVPAMPTAVSAAVAPTSGVVLGFTPTPMNPIATTGAIQGPQIPSTNASSFTGTIPTGNFTYGQGNPLNTNVYVTVQGSVTTEDDLVKKIASGLQNQSLSTGDSAYINRRTGGFAG
jgi:hypothetical protein